MRYRYDAATGRVRPVVAGPARRASASAFPCPTIRADGAIRPYESPASGRMIETRSERARDLRETGSIDARDLKGQRMNNGRVHAG